MSRSYVCSSKSTQLLFIISTIAAFVVNPPAAHALKIHTNPTNEYNTLKHRKLLLDQQTPLQQAISQYIPIDQLASYLKGYTKRCGDISRLITIGKSEKYSYPIYALEISDKPGVEEPEPNVKLVAGIHGDEPLGLILTTGLAEWLCANYNTDDTARKIVAQSHLYLVPTLNPDGYKDATRTNGKGYDLNRNFPDRFRNFTASNFPIQSETSAIINWLNQTQFVSSLAFHGGSLVANYPWDASRDMSAVYTAAPDDAAFKFLATTYSKAHASMAAQATEEFPDGMTNGAAWYSIQGSMQDYNYGVGKCMELTIELGDVKWPDKKALPKIFEDNRNSLLDFITASAFGGLHGTVTADASGKADPINQATIHIQGIDWDVQTNHLGVYYRALAPGKYTVEISKKGFESVSRQITVSSDGNGVTLNVALVESQKKASSL